MTDPISSPSGQKQANDIAAILQAPLVHWKKTLAGVLVVVAAAGGYALFGVYQKSQIQKAENELGAILTSKAGAERLAALEGLAKAAPAGARDGVLLEIAKTAQGLGDFAKAATAWQAISGTAPAGMKTVAGLGYATALSKSGQDAKAVEVLEALSISAPKTFAMAVDQQLAAAAEAAGQWDKAIGAFERMKTSGSVQNTGYLDARIAALKNKAAKGNG
ncbi:MAG: tetratricopeptide repeat protein [Solidesulfovibrio sp. DCME]|uniref:tetratricopeptide repeat protein n=1 Tax=Solidesulfovibrio sp. DCME TaxID=3447380 RepID=UPI003D0ECD82